MAKWFVGPAVVRVDLGDGEWAEIKERLTYGEQQQLNNAGVADVDVLKMQEHPEIMLNLARYTLRRMFLWLVDWSAKDERGKPVPITMEAIAALESDMAAKIDAAIAQRVEEITESKNAMAGAPSPETN